MSPVSVLYREPKLLKVEHNQIVLQAALVSVLYREPKLLKVWIAHPFWRSRLMVSVLYREPKLLKERVRKRWDGCLFMFQCSTVSRNC